MKQKTSGKINKWKWAFFLLLSCLVAFSLLLFSRITTSREQVRQADAAQVAESKIGSFTTNRAQLNEALSLYLKEYQTDTFLYSLQATNQFLLFEGKYELLGVDIPLYIYFQPSKLEDGSILLTVSEISAGTLSLPKGEILAYIQRSYALPDIVSIDAEQATVTLHLNALQNQQQLFIKANTIDLYNDQLIFDVYRKK